MKVAGWVVGKNKGDGWTRYCSLCVMLVIMSHAQEAEDISEMLSAR